MIFTRRAALDEDARKEILENVKRLLKDKGEGSKELPNNEKSKTEDVKVEKNEVEGTGVDETSKGETSGKDGSEGSVFLFDASRRLRQALEFNTKDEFNKYKETHKISPTTKVKILKPENDSDKEDDAVVDNKKKVEKTDKDVSEVSEVSDKLEDKRLDKTEDSPSGAEIKNLKPSKGDSTALTPDPSTLHPSHPARQTRGADRQIAVKDLALDRYGIDAKDFNTHKVYPSQVSGMVQVHFPNGESKRYNQLSIDERSRVDKAMLDGLVASKGLMNYDSVSIGAYNQNQETNLRLFSNPNVKEEVISSKEPATKENIGEFQSQLRDGGRALLKKHSMAMTGLSRPLAEGFVDDISDSIAIGVKDGSLSGISQAKLDGLMRESVKRLVHQEVETRRRSMGDHGIRHVVSNCQNTTKILDELKASGKEITGKQRLMGTIVMVDHDLGYTVGETAVNPAKGGMHKQNSYDLVMSEPDRYNEVFGEEDGEIMREMILTHDAPSLNWDTEPVLAAVRLADNTSLFGNDKVQDLFLRSPRASELACKMYFAASSRSDDRELQERIKDQMRKVVDDEFEDGERDLMHSQINEMSEGGFSTSKDILSRFSGRLDSFRYNSDTGLMNVNMKYSAEGQMVDKLFGDDVACRQFDKFAKDMGGTAVRGKRGNTVFKNPDGSKAFQLNIDGFDSKPTPHVLAMREFQKKTARFELQHASSMVASPPSPSDRDISRAKKFLEPSKGKFTDNEWKDLMKAFDSGKDMDKLFKKLGTWPALESEMSFLLGKTASRIAMDIVLSSIADRVSFNFESARGQQTRRKDKDLIIDTGGVSKKRSNPSIRPPRTDVSRRYRTKNKTDETRDPDIDVKEASKNMVANPQVVSLLSKFPKTFRGLVRRV